jgi:hypothetical protein
MTRFGAVRSALAAAVCAIVGALIASIYRSEDNAQLGASHGLNGSLMRLSRRHRALPRPFARESIAIDIVSYLYDK